ncbi:hypothetical protein OIU77_021042 [Salix suchowensis]|uniref:Uncharacterized protein n=1 Tax=Salix suchowensis TaxID=1278906 RepID=A0ABQ9CCA6_9ROSI|nr:hypothetical protein OIU77_021042 [Salix suchowensis]
MFHIFKIACTPLLLLINKKKVHPCTLVHHNTRQLCKWSSFLFNFLVFNFNI